MKTLPNQNDQPSIVFIFGAGASYPDGVPLQAELIPSILRDRDPQLKKSQVSKRIRRFLMRNFSHEDQFPSLEEVFGFINYFVSNDMSLSKEWTTQELIRIKSDLVKTIHYLISKNTISSENFSLFWKTVQAINRNIGVITTNYDTLIDEAFDGVYPECLIDFCLDFVNYRYPEKGTPFDWWIDPKKPTDLGSSSFSTRIKLVKIHGSLNWKYCDCCGQVALSPWQHQINLKQDSYESFIGAQASECPFDKNKLSSLIQVPTHLKTNHNYIFNKLYDEALYLVRGAKRLVFVGYSFPEADVHIRALVRQGFSESGKITVINKSRAKDLRHRYETLARHVDYHEMTFERFVRSRILKSLLSSDNASNQT